MDRNGNLCDYTQCKEEAFNFYKINNLL